MNGSRIALRFLGVATIGYAFALAWTPISLVGAAGTAGELIGALAEADAGTRDALAKEGHTAQELRDAVAASYRNRVLVEVAPDIAMTGLGVVAGVLLVLLRRRLGSSLLLLFLAWPVVGWGYGRIRTTLAPVKTSLKYLPEPATLFREVLRIQAFGREWELSASSLPFLLRAAFTLLALAILAWAFAADRRPTA